ncbi:MAG: M20/M25/M40 family metallo-hydrolase [Gemmatimonadota bacterium]|nr:M20/M25/M40 family metallo-hydrolase [Gemmatimonadota bacterium]
MTATGGAAPRRRRIRSIVIWTVALLVGLPLALAFVAWLYVVRMPGETGRGALAPLTPAQAEIRQRLERHVRELAGRIGERNSVHYGALEQAAAYVERELASLGYTVVSQQWTSADGRAFRNLEVTLPGRGKPAEVVVVGAHYDSNRGTPGADDNASGVAAVLELARLLQGHPHARTIRFVAFVNEELPFFGTADQGSRRYVAALKQRGDDVRSMLSVETIGYYATGPKTQLYPKPLNWFYPDTGNFIGFVGNLSSRPLVHEAIAAFRRHTSFPSHGAAAPESIPGVGWSDHEAFWAAGIPAIMITDTAPFRNPYYHTRGDTPDRIDYERMTRVVDGLVAVVRELARGG